MLTSKIFRNIASSHHLELLGKIHAHHMQNNKDIQVLDHHKIHIDHEDQFLNKSGLLTNRHRQQQQMDIVLATSPLNTCNQIKI